MNPRREAAWRMAVALGPVLGFACTEPPPPAPGQAHAVPPPAGAPAPAPVAPNPALPPGHPPIANMVQGAPGMGGGMAAVMGAPAGGGGTGQPIGGEIALDPALSAKVPKDAVLYIIARAPAQPGAAKGPPLAVLRTENAAFPFKYRLGPEHVMMQGLTLEGDLIVEARLDQDGDASTKQPGDITGIMAAPQPAGATSANFTLDTVLGTPN